jgi:RND family efflux transporter MFP subunit
MSVIAPFSGEVLYVESQPGDVVGPTTTAIYLADLDQLYVETSVDEADIAKIKVGNPITATLDAVPDVVLTGEVAAINPVGEQVSGLVKYTVLVGLDKMDEQAFLPLGTTVNVTIQVGEAAGILAVPMTTIQNDSQGEYVLLIQEDGTTRRVPVVSGAILEDLVAVSGDLKAGDRVSTRIIENNSFRGPFARDE